MSKTVRPNSKQQTVLLTFIVAMPFKEGAGVDEWLRGKSKFNIGIKNLPISEGNLFFVFQMLNAFSETFEKPLEEKPKLWMP